MPRLLTDQVSRAVVGARSRNQYADILLGSASQQDWHLPPEWDHAFGSLSGLCREARGCLGEPRVPRFPLNRLLPGMRIPCARLPIPPFSHPSPSQEKALNLAIWPGIQFCLKSIFFTILNVMLHWLLFPVCFFFFIEVELMYNVIYVIGAESVNHKF